jgi:hypothetical protein
VTEQTLKGSCLCGALQFVVTGEPARFFHCHCSRCRKSSGTGHASNLFISNGELAWAGDSALIKTYKLPGAQRFARTFCSTAGAQKPHFFLCLVIRTGVVIGGDLTAMESGCAPLFASHANGGIVMYHSRKTHARLKALLISSLAITPLAANSQVVLVPGEINGTVKIGTEVIQSFRISASNTDDSASQTLSPNAEEGPYKLTVNIRPGETATFSVRPWPIYTRDSDSNQDLDYFGFPFASVDVNDSGPSTQDFILAEPAYISGTVNLSGDGELKRVQVFATPQTSNGYIHYTAQSAGAEEKQSLSYEFPVSTGAMRYSGTAWLASDARISLPTMDVTVEAGGPGRGQISSACPSLSQQL